MGTQDLNATIAYFEEQSDSPFAAQVAKWLTELKDARQKISVLEYAAKINADAWAQQSQFACGVGSDNEMSSDKPLNWRPPTLLIL